MGRNRRRQHWGDSSWYAEDASQWYAEDSSSYWYAKDVEPTATSYDNSYYKQPSTAELPLKSSRSSRRRRNRQKGQAEADEHEEAVEEQSEPTWTRRRHRANPSTPWSSEEQEQASSYSVVREGGAQAGKELLDLLWHHSSEQAKQHDEQEEKEDTSVGDVKADEVEPPEQKTASGSGASSPRPDVEEVLSLPLAEFPTAAAKIMQELPLDFEETEPADCIVVKQQDCLDLPSSGRPLEASSVTASTDASDAEPTMHVEDDDITWHAEASWAPWPCEDGEGMDSWDEVQSGPDGELYEISYPAPAPYKSAAELWLEGYGEATDCTSLTSYDAEGPSAAAGIVQMLEEMHQGNVARHPARKELLSLIHVVVLEALGDAFLRLALVGSTALGIETPASDLDVVVFTREGGNAAAEVPTDILGQLATLLCAKDPNLMVQLVGTARVPVLVVWTAEGISLDLTVNRPLAEWHVLWFQCQETSLGGLRAGPTALQHVPEPCANSSFVACLLRCVKWWLRRRGIPTTKEGGYPSLVWSLMVMHVLRCSVLFGEAADSSKPLERGEAVLTALAAFFDRFSREDSFAGTLLFTQGMHAEFRPQFGGDFSVLDPTSTCSAEEGGDASVELAPRLSLATQLLHAFELRRAKHFSSVALSGMAPEAGTSDRGLSSLEALYAEVPSGLNLVPSSLPAERPGAIFLSDGVLQFGLLEKVIVKSVWDAPYLHRRDGRSLLEAHLCEVDTETWELTPRWQGRAKAKVSFHPVHFVCLANVQRFQETYGDAKVSVIVLDEEARDRWATMQETLQAASERNAWSAESQVPR